MADFSNYLNEYIKSRAVSFYRPVLSGLAASPAARGIFGLRGWDRRLLDGVSLLIGLGVRPASVLGILFLLNLSLAAWRDPGHDAPVWRHFAVRLDTLPLMLLFIIF
jgi:hypothetical protein